MRQPPAATEAQVWIDFDGTITQRDLLDDLIVNCSINDSWKQIEDRWQAGEIGSRQCLAEQIALLRVSDVELENILDGVRLDPGMAALVALLERFNVPRAILSDGIDLFIQRTLKRHGINMPVRSNTIERRGLEMKLRCPLQMETCETAAAHCKCGSILAIGSSGKKSIYIGDGRSDLCPARKVDFVFAKGALAAALEKEGREFARYETLADVKEKLERSWLGTREITKGTKEDEGHE